VVLSRAVTSIVIGWLASGCSGPASTQIAGSIRDSLPIGDATCLAQPKVNVFMAKPLCGKYNVDGKLIDASQTNDTNGPAFIGLAMADSLHNCQNFINTFTAGQATDNTILDVLSISLSALATVFVPANTVRALSGASTIAQGTKGAINSDFYQQLTVQLFIQAINGTYFKEYSDFLSTKQTLPFSQQFNKIEFFHKDCSIPFAAAQLSASQTKSSQSTDTSVVTADKLTNGAKFKGLISGNVYTVSVKATGIAPNATTTYSYLVTLPTGRTTSPTPQQTTSEALLALLTADHAVVQ
jgi:hypothetical protein